MKYITIMELKCNKISTKERRAIWDFKIAETAVFDRHLKFFLLSTLDLKKQLVRQNNTSGI